jgi:hypothetical protein
MAVIITSGSLPSARTFDQVAAVLWITALIPPIDASQKTPKGSDSPESVARDLRPVQGARRENIRMDLRPTSNAAAVLKIIHFLLRRESSRVGALAAGTAGKEK